MREIQFIHISDLHIGKKPEELLYGNANAEDVLATLRQVVSYAAKTNTDLIFITGDLFDHPASEQELSVLDEIFLPLANTAVIYCQGDRDYMGADSVLPTYQFRSNIYVVGCDTYKNPIVKTSEIYGEKEEHASAMIDVIHFDRLGLDVYGAGYYSAGPQMPVLDGIRPYHEERKNVLLAHAGYDGAIPADYPELRKAGFDYIGLGNHASYKNMYNGKICYAGSLEPQSADEVGAHGYIAGALQENRVNVHFVPASRKEYKTVRYPISNYMTDEEVMSDLKRILKREGIFNIFRICLVRQKGCERTFHIKEKLTDFRISEVSGERFERRDYTEYQKANRGNAFGRLLAQMEADSPVKGDGAKMAVDRVIECSRIYSRSSRRMSDRAFAEAGKAARKELVAEIDERRASGDLQRYEHTKELLSENQDVLDRLNAAWAEERKIEVELRTQRSTNEQILPRHRRHWIQIGFRAAAVPFVIFCIMAIFLLPGIYVRMTAQFTSGDILRFLITSIASVAACFGLGYLAVRVIDQNRSNGIRKELQDGAAREQELAEKTEKQRAVRKAYQLQDDKRRELQSDFDRQESRIAQMIVELQVMEEAALLLGKR